MVVREQTMTNTGQENNSYVRFASIRVFQKSERRG